MSELSVKLSDVDSQYDGVGDFCEWNIKFELGALEEILPLFLSNGALTVYQSLSDDVKADYSKLKRSLVRAFSSSPFQAYEELISCSLALSESVDVYVAKVKRLASLVSSSVDDEFIKNAVIAGFPTIVKHQLQAGCVLTEMSLPDVAEKARDLLYVQSQSVANVVLEGKCHLCGKPGHFSQSCWKLHKVGRAAGCYRCGDVKYLARDCPNRGNGYRGVRTCYQVLEKLECFVIPKFQEF
jgi:hypothetical protein